MSIWNWLSLAFMLGMIWFVMAFVHDICTTDPVGDSPDDLAKFDAETDSVRQELEPWRNGGAI